MTSIVVDVAPRAPARTAGVPPRTAGRIAGWGILAMALIAAFAEFSVRQRLVVPDDATATATNLMAHELLWRFGIAAFLVVIVLDVVVAWALYYLFKPVNKPVSGLMAMSRLVFATVFAVAVVNLSTAVDLVTDASSRATSDAGELNAQMMLSLNAFSSAWSVSLAFFGIHLALAGYLALTSGYMPKALGIALVIAGLGYAFDTFAGLLVRNYEPTAALFTFVGEVALFLWLLIRNAKIPTTNSAGAASTRRA
jgi:hypothetical protein